MISTSLNNKMYWKRQVNNLLTSLSFMANIIALACSAAFPTIGSNITPINEIGISEASEAP